MEPVRRIRLLGFDPAGEPEIRVMADGSLRVVFNFIPPSDMEDKEQYFLDHFDQQMSDALGVSVFWEDREVFCVEQPKVDTIERVKQFVQNYREMHSGEITG